MTVWSGDAMTIQDTYLYCRSMNNIPEFTTFIDELGGDSDLLLREAYSERLESKEKLNFIPWSAMVQLYDTTASDLNEPYFGMRWALALPRDFRNGGPSMFLFSISKTMEHFLNLMTKFQALHNNAVRYDYWIDETESTLIGRAQFHPMAQYSRQLCEHIMAVAALFGQRFIPDFEVSYVQFQHSPPASLEVYNEIFKCPVHFNCEANLIAIDNTKLKFKNRRLTNRVVQPLLKTFVNWQIKKNIQHQATVAMTLAELLPSLLGVRQSDIGTIAKAMNMKPKKLQRLLADEGTSYSQVLDDVRKNLASRLLLDSDIPQTRIALLLDYATDKPFIAAFKRWYGQTPARYRKEGRSS
ncbi:helix-turn-helix domain-containing protein [Fretibacter rubidus]|uniref:helix-turn-helix domain-containing protein n=1 Tax=Fretibacter rubidus TaxID=570162 RepID=UPI00352B0183